MLCVWLRFLAGAPNKKAGVTFLYLFFFVFKEINLHRLPREWNVCQFAWEWSAALERLRYAPLPAFQTDERYVIDSTSRGQLHCADNYEGIIHWENATRFSKSNNDKISRVCEEKKSTVGAQTFTIKPNDAAGLSGLSWRCASGVHLRRSFMSCLLAV